jgi:hypothetical protein
LPLAYGAAGERAVTGTHGSDLYRISLPGQATPAAQSPSQLLLYDVDADGWTVFDDPLGIIEESVAVVDGNQLVVETPSVNTGTQEVEIWNTFDFNTRQWAERIAFEPRTGLYDSRVALNGEVLVWPLDGNAGWAYSPSSRTIRALPTAGAPTGGVMHAVDATRAIVGSPPNAWFMYDSGADAWSSLPDSCNPGGGDRLGELVVSTDYGLLFWTFDSAKSDRRGEGRLLILDPAQSWGGK